MSLKEHVLREYIREYLSVNSKLKIYSENKEEVKETDIKSFNTFNFKLLRLISDDNTTMTSSMEKNLNQKLLIGMILYKIGEILGIKIGKFNERGTIVDKAYEFFKWMEDNCPDDVEYNIHWTNFEKYLKDVGGFHLKKITDASALKNDYDWNSGLFFSNSIFKREFFDVKSVKRQLRSLQPEDILQNLYDNIIKIWGGDTGLKYAVLKNKNDGKLKVVFTLGLNFPKNVSEKIQDGFENLYKVTKRLGYDKNDYKSKLINDVISGMQPDWYNVLTFDKGRWGQPLEFAANVASVVSRCSKKAMKAITTNVIQQTGLDQFEKTVEEQVNSSMDEYFKYLRQHEEEEKINREKEKRIKEEIKNLTLKKCVSMFNKTAQELNLTADLQTGFNDLQNNPEEYQLFKKVCQKIEKDFADVAKQTEAAIEISPNKNKKNKTKNKSLPIIKQGDVKKIKSFQKIIFENPVTFLAEPASIGLELFSAYTVLKGVNYWERDTYYEIEIQELVDGYNLYQLWNQCNKI